MDGAIAWGMCSTGHRRLAWAALTGRAGANVDAAMKSGHHRAGMGVREVMRRPKAQRPSASASTIDSIDERVAQDIENT